MLSDACRTLQSNIVESAIFLNLCCLENTTAMTGEDRLPSDVDLEAQAGNIDSLKAASPTLLQEPIHDSIVSSSAPNTAVQPTQDGSEDNSGITQTQR